MPGFKHAALLGLASGDRSLFAPAGAQQALQCDVWTSVARDQALVITKGDANYRRLLGDRHWAHDTDFAELMGYWPCALAALRTCKSGVLVGTAPDAEAAAAAAHPDKWLTAGLYGMVQFRP